MTAADYQREKDGYPDVDVCAECGVVLDPVELEAGKDLCDACEWDIRGDMGGEEQ